MNEKKRNREREKGRKGSFELILANNKHLLAHNYIHKYPQSLFHCSLKIFEVILEGVSENDARREKEMYHAKGETRTASDGLAKKLFELC